MSAPSAEPLLFGGARPRFGWVHHAGAAGPASASAIALVIVPPFGYEAICAHRALRHLAQDAAAAGLLAIRFDLDGTGDSAGDDLEAGRVEAWLASIGDACDLARMRGANRVVLAGVRLGASLASLAAARRTDVAGLVAIAPVTSGKAYLRELRMLQGALGLEPPPPAAAHANDVDEALGFAINPETRAGLAAIDLVRAAQRPAPAVLVIDRDDLPATDAWQTKLAELGAEVHHARLPGYVEMVLDPHQTKIPTAIIERTIEFTLARAPLAGSHEPPAAISGDVAAALASNGTLVTEEIVRLDAALFGIASRPQGTVRRALILLNSGAIHHIGPNRLYVTLARRLAAKGTLVLRLDLSGIGDSPARGSVENAVYSEYALADVGAAVAWARRSGASHVTVAGVCSGAYHALKAAVESQPIDMVVPINPLTFFWKPDMPLDFPSYQVTADARRYVKSVRSATSWKKVLRGDVDVRYAAQIVVRRAREAAGHRGRDVLRRLRVPLVDDLGAELLALGRNGVTMRFVFAASDPGHAMLHEHGGGAVARLAAAGKLEIQILEGPDHTFTARWTHPLVLDAIERAAGP